KLMPSVRQCQAIFIGVKISGDAQVAAIVAAGDADGSLGVGGSAAPNDHGADGVAEKKTGDAGRGSAGGGFSGEEVAGAGKAEARGVQQGWREHVRFFEADYLLAQCDDVRAEG